MSIELMLNAVNLAFVTFSRRLDMQGQVFVSLSSSSPLRKLR